MRLTLTDEQQMIQTMAREFAESEIASRSSITAPMPNASDS